MNPLRRPVALLAVLLFCCPSWSQTKPFGLGVIAGEPTGGTIKVWFNRYFGMDMAAGADFGPYSHNPFNYRLPAAFQAHCDFLAHVPIFHPGQARIPLYIGVGPQFGWWRHDGMVEQYWRVRTPIGLALLTPRPPFPWELFVEFVPTWAREPRIFDPDLAAGARYYF
jgi:hypothetical protein